MTPQEARSYLNYLLTLSLRREEAFGPLALTFVREQDLGALGLEAEEQFNLLFALTQAFAEEPKRYTRSWIACSGLASCCRRPATMTRCSPSSSTTTSNERMPS